MQNSKSLLEINNLFVEYKINKGVLGNKSTIHAVNGVNLNIEKGEIDENFDFDKDKLTCDYIKKLNAPVELKDDGRITVVD